MNSVWKVLMIAAGVALAVAACAPAAPSAPAAAPAVPEATQPPLVTEEPAAAVVPAAAQTITLELPLVAKKVSEMPTVDGTAADPAWKDAKALKVGVLNMKAVYDGTDIAFLMSWPDRDLSINSRGTFAWDPATKAWSRTGMQEGSWDSFKGNRHPEWVNVAFDISSVVSTQGCFAFCHEYPPGSGVFHHNTAGAGQYVDSWGLLAKHGYGKTFIQDMGWTLGSVDVIQNGSVAFDPADTMDPSNILTGDVTFVGYSEDKIIAPIDDTKYPMTDRPADTYCIDCHTQTGAPEWTKTGNTTFGDDGELPYRPNWNADQTFPVYMETAPVNFADSMVLTQAEIDSGEAVAVADLSPEQISEYWTKYADVNGFVPHLVLQKPTGSQADVLTAANWKNGVWTTEFTRKMVNGNFDDVQFDDLGKPYSFGISLWNHTDLLAPLMRFVPGTLTFEQ